MRRLFRITDCSQHVGLPVKAACFLLNVFSCPLYIFVLYFTPASFVVPLMVIELIIGIIGLVGSLYSVRVFVVVYIVAQILMTIPVWVAGAYVIFTLVNYNGWSFQCFNGQNYYQCDHSDYLNKMFNFDNWILWVSIILACIGTVLMCFSIAGFRKLRQFILQGLNNQNTTNPPAASQHVAQPAVIQPPVYVLPQEQAGNMIQQQYPVPQQSFIPQGTGQPVFIPHGYEPPPAYLEMTTSTIESTLEEKEGKYG